MKNKLVYAFAALFALVLYSGNTSAQTTDVPPDFPINDDTLVDPDASDFSSDIFSEDFGTDGTNDATDTTDTTDTTTDVTDSTATSETTTTTVADTASGPKENAIFWVSFLTVLLILQTTKQLLKERRQNDVF